MSPILEARGLDYTYDDGTAALAGVNFRLFPGETVALLGANGSGKTTFVLRLVGLLEGAGEVVVGGVQLTRKTAALIRSKVGIVFQDSDEQLFMPSVLEDIAFGPRNLGQSQEQALKTARQSLEMIRLSHLADRAPYHLSAGEKRRVALAGVLAMSPEVVILDEPTTFLDPPSLRDLIDLLGRLPQAKILITHDIAFAKALAPRACFFERGRIVAEGKTHDIVRQFQWEL
ncbi:MAG: ABC transporter ATP-binding protein [Bryobacteraceae bacterium]|nr:ABC transporter ATP-binding protein [Bryobacteraceae bacterium]